MKYTTTLLSPILLSTLLLTGCAQLGAGSSNDPASENAAFLQYADEDAVDKVNEARFDMSSRSDALAAARLKLRDAKQLRSIAKEQADVVEERLELAEARSDAAHSDRVIEASAEMTDGRELELAMAETRVGIYDAVVAAREANVDLAEARLNHAEARVGLASALAIQDIDRSDRPEVSVEDHELELREQETEVELAETRYGAAVEEVRLANEAYSGNTALFPEMEREVDAVLSSVSK